MKEGGQASSSEGQARLARPLLAHARLYHVEPCGDKPLLFIRFAMHANFTPMAYYVKREGNGWPAITVPKRTTEMYFRVLRES